MLIETARGCNISDFFSVVVTSEMVKKEKPDPEVYKIALSELNIDPDRCIAMEDSLNGLLSTGNAGLWTIRTPSFLTQDDNFF